MARQPAFRIGVVAMATLMLCLLYVFFLNPEIQYYLASNRVKTAWAEKMDREYTNKVVVFGGSSCQFSIDGERMLKVHGLPCVNLGGGASMESQVLTHAALEKVRSGDTLVVALEPGLLAKPFEFTSLAVQYAFAVKHPEWVIHPTLDTPHITWPSAILALRPGGRHIITLLAKLVCGKPLYRYQPGNIHQSGWAQTPVHLPLEQDPSYTPVLSEDGRRLLSSLKSWCETNNVKLAYSIPWAYCPPDKVDQFRRTNAKFLSQVAAIIPVFQTPFLGASTNAVLFSDSYWHLREEGASMRVDELARQVISWNCWDSNQLMSLYSAGSNDFVMCSNVLAH